jgi:hypothetical protein
MQTTHQRLAGASAIGSSLAMLPSVSDLMPINQTVHFAESRAVVPKLLSPIIGDLPARR